MLAHLLNPGEPEPRQSVLPNPGRFAPPRQSPDAVDPLPISGTWDRAHGAVPAPARVVSPLVGQCGPAAHMAARALSRAEIPLDPFNRELLFFFFSHFPIYIYTHVDILCTKNSPNIL
jgi:hypothetical protein